MAELVEDSQNEVQFCTNCGKKISSNSKFCKHCGNAVEEYLVNDNNQESTNEKASNVVNDNSKRKMVFEGTLHKCPNCGEELSSFLSTCPSCGHEMRDVKSSVSLTEFEKNLNIIDSRTMPPFKEESPSFLKKIFGNDFKDVKTEEDAKKAFEKQKIKDKANYIVNFPIPNSREDILEFALIVSSNIKQETKAFDNNSEDENILTKAWNTKFDQLYRKAKIALTEQKDLDQIEEIHKEVDDLKNIKKNVIIGYFGFLGLGLLVLLLMTLLSSGDIIQIIVGILILAVITFIVYLFLKKFGVIEKISGFIKDNLK